MTAAMFRHALVAAATALLAACATATPYQPRTDGYGYAEQRIEKNRFRISFRGNAQTPREKVETYLLYRAAELTLQAGYDYFVFASEDTDANTRYQQSFHGYYGYAPYYWYPYPYGALDAGTATPVTQYVAQANVVMFRGRKNEKDVRAFDAREVKGNLEASIERPAPQP